MEVERVLANALDIFDDTPTAGVEKELFAPPETLDAMVRVLVRHVLTLIERERRDWSLERRRLETLVHNANFNENAARNWAKILERAVNEHPDGKTILANAKEVLDSTWMYDPLAELPF